MKKIRWCLLVLSFAMVGCVANWNQIIEPNNNKTPAVQPTTSLRPVTEEMLTEQNAHEVAQRQWDELDQEEFQLQRITSGQVKPK